MVGTERKDLAVVIVSWNVKDVLLENLRLVFASSPMPSLDVIVVDNASHDGTVEAIRSAYPQVRIISNHENLGFAKACNQGLAAAAARHALLLNPDMRVEPDTLSKTVAYLDAHPDVAVLSAKLIGEDGKPMHHLRRFPTLFSQAVIAFKLQRVFPGVIDRYMGKDLDLDKEQDVESVRGAFFAINRTALHKIGSLDERYFIWMEEVDYCRQAKQKGMRVRYVPSIVAHDLVGKSFSQRNKWWKRKQFAKSMATYFWKWL